MTLHTIRYRLLIPLGVAVACGLVSCSSTDTAVEPPVTELKPAEKSGGVVDASASEEDLFMRGKKLYSEHLYSAAKAPLESLSLQYPLGPYGEYAAIKSADSDFEAASYSSAITRYEQFLNSYPLSQALPYVYMRTAQAYFAGSRGPERDPTPLSKSYTHLETLMTKYPNSVYQQAAKILALEVLNELLGHEMAVSDFYAAHDAPQAAEVRKQEALAKYQPKIDALLGEAKASLTLPVNDTVLNDTVPTTTTLPEAPQLLSVQGENGEKRAEGTVENSEESKSPHPTALPISPTPVAPATGYTLRKLECDTNQLVIYLNKLPEREKVTIANAEHGVTITIKALTTPPKQYTCSGVGEVVTRDQEIIDIHNTTDAKIMLIDYPPRVIAFFNVVNPSKSH